MHDEPNAVTWLGLALLLCVALAFTLLLGRAWRGDDPAASTLARARATGTVRIGYANEAPYGYLESRTGRITGEAPEIARVVLARMGIDRIEPVVAEFGSLIPGLKAGRFDVIAAGMYITPERCREIAFSNPSYRVGEAFVVARGNPLRLHSFEDVAANPTARLGVVGGAVEHRYARQTGIPDARIVLYPDNTSALAGVAAGRVDAFAATILTVNDLLRKAQSDDLERADPFHDPVLEGVSVQGYGAFGFRKEDRDFVEQFNRHLAGFLGSREHLDLVRPFGFSAHTLPGDTTAEQLCAAGGAPQPQEPP